MSTYVTSSDIDARYGIGNRQKWADMEGLGPTANATAIAARTTDAITYASSFIDDYLRNSKFSFVVPITGTVPDTIKDICRKIAAYQLSVPRGVSDYTKDGDPITPLWVDYQDALMKLKMIVNQEIVLDLAS
jgi:phage gp36-like protein